MYVSLSDCYLHNHLKAKKLAEYNFQKKVRLQHFFWQNMMHWFIGLIIMISSHLMKNLRDNCQAVIILFIMIIIRIPLIIMTISWSWKTSGTTAKLSPSATRSLLRNPIVMPGSTLTYHWLVCWSAYLDDYHVVMMILRNLVPHSPDCSACPDDDGGGYVLLILWWQWWNIVNFG